MSSNPFSKRPFMVVKLCGNVSVENIKLLDPLKPDWLGLIFYPPSPRYFRGNPSTLAEVSQTKVGVFVDMPYEKIVDIADQYCLDYLQLHGNESSDYCKRLKKHYPIIKSFGVDENFNFSRLHRYEKHVDFFLFDSVSALRGGSGKKFDRGLIKQYTLSKPYILSGGIDFEEAIALVSSPYDNMLGIDINSQFEYSPGIKNNVLIQKLLSLTHYGDRDT